MSDQGRRRPRPGGQRTGGPRRARADERPHRPPPNPHRLRLEVTGRGMELHCEGCDLVVGRLPGATVRPAVEAAHRAHLGELRFDSGWFGECSCGWRSPKAGQEQARALLDEHWHERLREAMHP